MARCINCSKRLVWCHWCKVHHCACLPHVRRRQDYLGKVHTIRRADGQTRLMAARRYAHLRGAQRGGLTTAGRPNPGRFTPATARKAALARWLGRHKTNARTGLRLGLPRKNVAPRLSRRHLRWLYARAPRLGVRYLPITGQWVQGTVCISERTALRRLGHLNYARRNWVPGNHEPILATTIGIATARRRDRRTDK